MKHINKIIIVVFALGLFPMSSCDEDSLTDLNIDPNASVEIDLRFNLSQVMLRTAENRYVNWRANIIYSGHLIQHFAGDNYSAGYTYTRFPSHSSSYFDRYYLEALKEAGEILRQTGPDGVDSEMTNTYNVTRILYAFCMHRMTDLYGNVPYFEASRGIEGIFNPHYDHQRDIYTKVGIDEGGVRGGILWELQQAAIGLGSAGTDDLASADMIYQGDLTKWRKLAYSLILKLGMRIYEVDPANGKQWIDVALASNMLMENNLDNCTVPMAMGPDIWWNQNGYSRAWHPEDGGHGTILGEAVLDLLKGADPGDVADDDPRLMIISGGIGQWADIDAGTADIDPLNQWGEPPGLNSVALKEYLGLQPEDPADIQVIFSRLNPKLLDLDETHVLVTYGETQLTLAEIAQRGISSTPMSAQEHFEEGITADINRYVFHDASFARDPGDITTFLATLGAVDEEKIAAQFWIASIMQNSYEAYANWRRTGMPSFVAPPAVGYPSNVSNNQIFRRLEYPTSEPGINPNYSAGATLPNDFMTRIWWDGGD